MKFKNIFDSIKERVREMVQNNYSIRVPHGKDISDLTSFKRKIFPFPLSCV